MGSGRKVYSTQWTQYSKYRVNKLTMSASASAAERKTASEMWWMPATMTPRLAPGKMYALLPCPGSYVCTESIFRYFVLLACDSYLGAHYSTHLIFVQGRQNAALEHPTAQLQDGERSLGLRAHMTEPSEHSKGVYFSSGFLSKPVEARKKSIRDLFCNCGSKGKE